MRTLMFVVETVSAVTGPASLTYVLSSNGACVVKTDDDRSRLDIG